MYIHCITYNSATVALLLFTTTATDELRRSNEFKVFVFKECLVYCLLQRAQLTENDTPSYSYVLTMFRDTYTHPLSWTTTASPTQCNLLDHAHIPTSRFRKCRHSSVAEWFPSVWLLLLTYLLHVSQPSLPRHRSHDRQQTCTCQHSACVNRAIVICYFVDLFGGVSPKLSL